MGDAGRHFADRRQPLLDARVALEFLDAGHVLKCDQNPRAPPGRLEVRRAQADVDLATAVGGAVPPFEPPSAAAAQSLLHLHDELLRELQRFRERPARHRSKREPGNGFGGVIEREDTPRGVGGRQPARQAVDDVLIEGLQIGNFRGGLFEPDVRGAQPLGERSAQQRDREEPEEVQRDRVLRDRSRRERHGFRGKQGIAAAARRPPGTAPAPGRRT